MAAGSCWKCHGSIAINSPEGAGCFDEPQDWRPVEGQASDIWINRRDIITDVRGRKYHQVVDSAHNAQSYQGKIFGLKIYFKMVVQCCQVGYKQ